MNLFSSRHAVVVLSIVAWSTAPLAWSAPSREQIEATYRLERAACLAGQSQHERSSCLREAGAVRAEARAGQRASSASPAALRQNALLRCKDLPRENQAICERMVGGEGSVSGSVAGGGLIRELVTEVPPASATEPATPAIGIEIPVPAR